MSINENLGVFQNLEKLPIIEEQQKEILERLKNLEDNLIPKLDLTKRRDVKKFLGVSDSTIHNMMTYGKLKRNIHYFKKQNGRIEFVEDAILKLKKE